MRIRQIASFALALAVVMFTVACSGSPVISTTVATLSITGAAPAVGGKSQFSAQAVLPDGTVENVTSTATWQSANTAIATVSTTGLVTGVSAGTTTVTVTFQGVSVIQTVTI